MNITTRITIADDGTVSLAEPIPKGEYLANVQVPDAAAGTVGLASWADLPQFDVGPFPKGTTFSCEEIFGDDGR